MGFPANTYPQFIAELDKLHILLAALALLALGALVLVTRRMRRASADDETKRSLRQVRALREIDRAITSTLDLRTVMDLLLEKIDPVLPYSATTVRLFNKKNGLLEPVACRNLDEVEWKSVEWKGGRGIPNQAASCRRLSWKPIKSKFRSMKYV